MVNVQQFDSLMGLAVTAIIFALQQLETGVLKKRAIIAEEYEKVYNEVLDFIKGTIYSD